MRKIILTLIIITFNSSVFSQKKNEEEQINKTLLSKLEKQIFEDLNSIISTSKPRNYRNITALNKVASYIETEFKKVCDTTSSQPYQVNNKIYKNIIGSLGVKNKERIIIGAHYDVFGESDGADDNASGVAGLLALARRLSEVKDLKYRIDFVGFTLEEPPFFRTEKMGSFIHAKSLYDAKVPLKGMICLETIGYYTSKPNSQEFPIKEMEYVYGNKGDFITVIKSDNSKTFSNQLTELIESQKMIKTVSFKGNASVKGIDFSDHLNYWKFNYDAVMITNTAFFRNKNYHTSKDIIETIDVKKMNLVITQLYNALINLN